MTSLKLPKLGSTMDEGMIVSWHVSPGDMVQAGDVLYEVTTDKVNMEVEADQPLKMIRLLAPVGATVMVGGEVALIETDDTIDMVDEESPSVQPAEPSKNQTDSTIAVNAANTAINSAEVSPVRASPASRHLARTLGIDLTTITGTGPRGRIIPADVEAKKIARADTTSEKRPQLDYDQQITAGWKGPRAVIAQRMSQSALIPQVTLTMAVNVRSVIAIRAAWTARSIKISMVDFVLLAVSRMLMNHPELNGWAENGLFTRSQGVHLGYAVDVPNKGLYVVTLQDTHTLPLVKIAAQRQERTTRVLNGQATLEDLGKPSFTVTNLGPMGVETFNPLLMPPQVGILGVGAICSTSAEDRLMLSLTFDHRVIDGAPAARALKQVKELLEMPGLLL